MDRNAASIYDWFIYQDHEQGKCWTIGQPYLSSSGQPCLSALDSSLAADEDHIIAVLKHSDRVRHICFNYLRNSLCEKIWAMMQVSFPDLTMVSLGSNGETAPLILDSFLGLSAPRLLYMQWRASHSRDCRNCFRLPLASLNFAFKIFLTLGTFRPKRWSLTSPH